MRFYVPGKNHRCCVIFKIWNCCKKNSMVVVIGSKCEVVSHSVGRMKDANSIF
jgi:hypothetical protein